MTTPPISAFSVMTPTTGVFSRARLTDVRQDCVLCDAADAAVLCVPCRATLPHNVYGCPGCAAPNHLNRCGACLAAPLTIDHALAVYQYQFPLDRLIQSFKFNANLVLVDFLAGALATAVVNQWANSLANEKEQAKNPTPAVLAPTDITLVALPLANRRLAERGFNQSALIADRLGQLLNIPVAHQTMLRIRDTPPQSGLSRQARLKNIQGAFDCAHAVAGKNIVLIDDVMTTGATLSEAAKVLKRAGAARVEAWVVARAVLDGANR